VCDSRKTGDVWKEQKIWKGRGEVSQIVKNPRLRRCSDWSPPTSLHSISRPSTTNIFCRRALRTRRSWFEISVFAACMDLWCTFSLIILQRIGTRDHPVERTVRREHLPLFCPAALSSTDTYMHYDVFCGCRLGGLIRCQVRSSEVYLRCQHP
jgi:hypothetical protein